MDKTGKYEKIKKEIIVVLQNSPRPLKYEDIQGRVHAGLSNDVLSPDSVKEQHTPWNKYEWEHEIRRAVFLLKQARIITYDKKNRLYSLVDLKTKESRLHILLNAADSGEVYGRTKGLQKRDLTELIAEVDREINDVERYSTNIERFKRNESLPTLLKIKYDFKCQFCGFTFRKRDGGFYAEVAHIVPLKDGGTDTSTNMLVLCANHHRMLDLAEAQVISRSNDSIEFQINGERYRAGFLA